jgi:uncharacterized protein (DUF2235 family)
LLARAIKKSEDQIVYYQAGVGSSLGLWERLRGAFGVGLMEHVREAYGFLAHNWIPGDEIYLFGFSRGAYTARSVAGLISDFGLLSKRGMDGIGEVLDAYRKSEPTADKQKAFDALGKKYERTAINVPIQFIGVWETVGELGIPDFYMGSWNLSLLNSLILKRINAQYQFSDVNLHDNVKNAFHAYILTGNH